MSFLVSLLVVLLSSMPAHSQTDLKETSLTGQSCEDELAAQWIANSFAGAPVVSGSFQGRIEVESPAVLDNVSVSEARYAVSILERELPKDSRVALSKVRISDLRSSTKFGGGIKTHESSPDVELFLVNVTIDPKWPHWVSYANTNYDGIVLDGAAAIYAQNLTITNWNADSAIDNKAQVSQLVNVTITGPGYRPIRYWRPGPHYLVDARISRDGDGTLLWFKDCGATTVFVYNSLFNGASRVPESGVYCEKGSNPNIVYLTEDPVIKGEMHPMFQRCTLE